MTKWTGTKQRDDLKPCPFCGTAAVQQVRMSDETDSQIGYRIGCGSSFCLVEPNTAPCTTLRGAEETWQERHPETV